MRKKINPLKVNLNPRPQPRMRLLSNHSKFPVFSPSSTTASPPPLPLQPTHSSGTTKPPFQLSDQLQQHEEPALPSSSTPGHTWPTLGLLPAIAASIAAPFLLHTLGPS